MEKQIDIIIPAYNAHNTNDKALASIACQNISDKIKSAYNTQTLHNSTV